MRHNRIIVGVVGAAIGGFIAFAIATGGRVPEQSVYQNAEAAAAKLSTPVQ